MNKGMSESKIILDLCGGTGSWSRPLKKYNKWEAVPKLNLYTRPGRGKPNFAYLHKSAWYEIPQLSFHKPETDAEFRAMTPPGFARAFFEANRDGNKLKRMKLNGLEDARGCQITTA